MYSLFQNFIGDGCLSPPVSTQLITTITVQIIILRVYASIDKILYNNVIHWRNLIVPISYASRRNRLVITTRFT